MEKLRILCLHGYHGSALILKDQMRPLAQALDHLAEFVYVDAPSIAQGDFGWWHAMRSDAAPRAGDPGVTLAPARYEGWSLTREAIASIFDKEGPFDGVFGFSQGAALAALLVGLRSLDALPEPHRPLVFDFVMMAGAFLVNDPALMKFYSARASYDLPSLHIIGQADRIVPASCSQKLAAQFKDPLVLQHDGGHAIASTPSIRKQIVAFLQQRVERRQISTVSRGRLTVAHDRGSALAEPVGRCTACVAHTDGVPVTQMNFRRRNCSINAVQWFKAGDHAAVEIQDGKWCVATPEGWRTVVPGDWIVTGDDRNPFPMSNHLFLTLYERLDQAESDRSDPPNITEP